MALRVEVLASRVQSLALKVEVMASRVQSLALRVQVLAVALTTSLLCVFLHVCYK